MEDSIAPFALSWARLLPTWDTIFRPAYFAPVLCLQGPSGYKPPDAVRGAPAIERHQHLVPLLSAAEALSLKPTLTSSLKAKRAIIPSISRGYGPTLLSKRERGHPIARRVADLHCLSPKRSHTEAAVYGAPMWTSLILDTVPTASASRQRRLFTVECVGAGREAVLGSGRTGDKGAVINWLVVILHAFDHWARQEILGGGIRGFELGKIGVASRRLRRIGR